MKVGYARVSTLSQVESLRAQSLELETAGCERVFTDIASGTRSDRPGLAAAVAYLRAGDMLTVTRLDRVGRTTVDTLKTVRDLDARGIRVTARDLDLDTATPAGKLVVSVLASLAEWERETLRERTAPVSNTPAPKAATVDAHPPYPPNKPMRPWPHYAAA